MQKVLNFCSARFDFKFYKVNWINILFFCLIFPACKFLPESAAYENSWFENIQLFVLFLGLYFALTTKFNRTFFKFVALVIGILLVRETNCLRTIFFCVPGEVNSFYTWKEIKYGWLAHPLYGCYMAWTAIYFFWKKLYLVLDCYIKSVKVPIWNLLFLVVAIFMAWAGEHIFGCMMLEEASELLVYVVLISIIYLYSRIELFNTEQ